MTNTHLDSLKAVLSTLQKDLEVEQKKLCHVRTGQDLLRIAILNKIQEYKRSIRDIQLQISKLEAALSNDN
jgi:hypothetical protein